MKINLHKLACELARMDDPSRYNENVIAAQSTLKALGCKLRACSSKERIAICKAIIERSGKAK